ncbi:hypothetical protein GCM10007049_07620 [Echinicola pacifica]|uniref:Uncharacterized protein n=1 Tax=Echinicola pacifica TaxID=346377 RepID=A0A918PQB3_9BACT|nr:hypothetical protein [Echinicola pacifica]GGZ17525.1 hypothetical protein GCM10007049_07620 [Echinicola pacifica]
MVNNILEIAILEMIRQKGEEAFSPLEIIKWIYPQDWCHFEEDILAVSAQMSEKGLIGLDMNGNIHKA